MHTWKEEHLAFLNADVPELLAVDHSEEHATLVLVEPFLHPHTFEHESRRASRKQCARGYLGFVDMVVKSLVRPADDHHGEILARIYAVVVHGRFEKMAVLVEPFDSIDIGHALERACRSGEVRVKLLDQGR